VAGSRAVGGSSLPRRVEVIDLRQIRWHAGSATETDEGGAMMARPQHEGEEHVYMKMQIDQCGRQVSSCSLHG
jgi:hypothetical protein